METQDYAFEPGLTVGELLKSSQKDWQAAINHRFLLRNFFAGTIENKVLKDYLIQDYHFLMPSYHAGCLRSPRRSA